MTETEFTHRADAVLFEIGEAIDASEADCDWEVSDGILSIDMEGGKAIINRHIPNREIWLASSTGGAAHFRFDGSVWRDTRGEDTLAESVRRVFAKQAGALLDLSAL